jgi:hypothetical protein
MRPFVPDDDPTVRVKGVSAGTARSVRWALAGAGAAAALALLAVWLLWPRPAPPPPVAVRVTPPPVAAPAAPRPPPVTIATADEAAIRAHAATALTVFRLAPDPRVVVLDFPTLHEQGAMLNRVAALIEKAGQPRDRVLDDAALAAAIKASGDTPDTYYYGHDYSAAELRRFFALADAEHLPLDPEEERLRALLRELGWFAPDAMGGLISVPRVPEPQVEGLDAAARAAILHHELAHGFYFSDPGYVAYVARFWATALTEAERAAIRHFLGSQGYDTADDDLMRNEMQAYLMFTADPRFFQAANIGMTPARRQQLAATFLAGMAPGWLHDALAQGIQSLR